jgi:hypothetical protein
LLWAHLLGQCPFGVVVFLYLIQTKHPDEEPLRPLLTPCRLYLCIIFQKKTRVRYTHLAIVLGHFIPLIVPMSRLLFAHLSLRPDPTISERHDECCVCKVNFEAGEQVKELPCVHVFHPECVDRWLQQRNFCPMCRYELSTDDADYEARRAQQQQQQQQQQNNSNSTASPPPPGQPEGDGASSGGNSAPSS